MSGAACLGVGWLTALQDPVPAFEEHLFTPFNDLPGWAADALWPVMQLGAVWGALVVALGCVAVWRRLHPALDVLVAATLAWALSGAVKDIVGRGRPSVYLTDVIVREGDLGEFGFVSGHTSVAFAVATALAPQFGWRGRVVVFGAASLVGVARMVHGVHFPADVVGGAGLGLLCGVAVRLLFDRLTPDPPAR